MKHLIFIMLFIALSFFSFSQKYTLSGYVIDEASSEHIIGAYIYDINNKSVGTSTNTYGFFSLTFKNVTTNQKLGVSFVGYQDLILELNLKRDTLITVSLLSNSEIDEVIITGTQNKIKTSQMSSIDIPLNAVQKLPVLFGEVDVLKTIQLMPGVQSGSEGTSGVYVRGGGPDQNLILLDGVPVYNVNHLFGFFSVFNGYAVKDITLIKGGFPARYGGRLSSVIDIRMKEGNMKKFSGEASSSFIASKFSFEGPIVKDKTSFIISARRTYLDVLAAPVIKIISKANDFGSFWGGYYFYDVNAKINHKFSDKDRLYLSVYTGKDKAYVKTEDDFSDYDGSYYKSKSEFDLHWGNLTSSLRWNHIFAPKLFGNTTLTYSKYNFTTELSDVGEYSNYSPNGQSETNKYEYAMSYFSGIEDIALKFDFDYLPSNNHKIKFGASGINHTFKPGVSALRIVEGSEDIDRTYGSKDILAQELSLYAEDDIKIGNRLKFNIGGRASGLSVQDTFYYSLEPRISARFLITDNWSVKAAYSQMTQYLHFLTNSTIGLPTDLWLPATKRVPPQHSTQYAAGTVFSLPFDLNVTIEAYHKEMTNLIEYKEGSSFFDDPEDGSIAGLGWEDKIEIGKGTSYGAEFMLSKNVGNLTGWLAYTWSKTTRQFDNISFGEVFPYRYDRRHDGSVALTYKINDKIDIGATWVYGTGISVTLAQHRYLPINSINRYLENQQEINQGMVYYGEGGSVEYYGKRNNYVLPAYHRLDLSINFTKKVKYGTRTWNISIYNAYNRWNAFYVDFNGGLMGQYYNPNKRQLVKYSLFPIIPSVSYNYKFK